VSATDLPHDPLWPRANSWIVPSKPGESPASDLAIIGIPAYRTSITPTGAHATPQAVREALARFSTFAGGRGVDLSLMKAIDLGDVEEPDGDEGEKRVRLALSLVRGRHRLLVILGGDNSATYSAMRGLAGDELRSWGLVTVDAHHDVRDGISNGSPVRRLIDAGLPGPSIAQIGIADFANSAAYAARAREYGITVITRDSLRSWDMIEAADSALAVAGRNARPVYVDLDLDVCDRGQVPGCHAALPGGITADELRQLAYAFGRSPAVRAIDLTEVDALADAPDGRTVRLAALLVLEAAAGLAARSGGPRKVAPVASGL
jgi:formiminoglutamase